MNNQNETDLTISNENIKKIQLGEDLEYLNTLPQFQRIMIDGYMMERLVNQSKEMIDMNPALRQQTMEEIMAVNYLRRYLDGVINEADVARARQAGEE